MHDGHLTIELRKIIEVDNGHVCSDDHYDLLHYCDMPYKTALIMFIARLKPSVVSIDRGNRWSYTIRDFLTSLELMLNFFSKSE